MAWNGSRFLVDCKNTTEMKDGLKKLAERYGNTYKGNPDETYKTANKKWKESKMNMKKIKNDLGGINKLDDDETGSVATTISEDSVKSLDFKSMEIPISVMPLAMPEKLVLAGKRIRDEFENGKQEIINGKKLPYGYKKAPVYKNLHFVESKSLKNIVKETFAMNGTADEKMEFFTSSIITTKSPLLHVTTEAKWKEKIKE